MFYTYILKSLKDSKLYTGFTDNLRKRFSLHNSGRVSSTKGRGPFDLIYYEACKDKEDALDRERYLKTGMGKRYIRSRLKRFLSLTGLVLVMLPTFCHASSISPPNNLGLVGWWKFDENTGLQARDASGNGNTGVLSGAVKPSWTTGHSGSGLDFSGGASIVTLPTSASLNISGDITLSVWIKSSSAASTKMVIGGYNFNSPWQGYGLTLGINGSCSPGQLCFWRGTGSWLAGSRTNLNDGKWHHAVARISGSTLNYFVDGKQDGGDIAAGPVVAFSGPRAFGGLSDFENLYTGQIDDVRIYNRALSAAEIQKLYKSGQAKINKITPVRLNKGLVGYWSFDGNTMYNNVADLSGNGNNGLLQPTNATSSMLAIGKLGQALSFNGTNQYVNTSFSTTGFSAVTMSAWVNIRTNPSGAIAAVAGGCGGASSVCLDLESGSATGKLRARFNTSVSGSVSVQTTTILTHGTWYHAVVVYDGSTLKIYLNGINESTTSGVTGTLVATTYPFGIGGSNNNVVFLNGSLDDVRVYSRILSQSEINALYKMGQGGKMTSLTNRLTDGLIGYWTMDGKNTINNISNVASSTGNGYLLPASSNSSTTSKLIGKIGQGLYLNGTQHVHINNFFPIGPYSNFSISSWVKFKKYPGGTNVSAFINDNGPGQFVAEITSFASPANTFSIIAGQGGSGIGLYSNSSTFNLNTWYHLVGTWNGVTKYTTLYIDGVRSAGGGYSLNSYTAATSTGGWAFGTQYYGGSNANFYPNFEIDDVRMYNRVLSVDEIKQLYNMGR